MRGSRKEEPDAGVLADQKFGLFTANGCGRL